MVMAALMVAGSVCFIGHRIVGDVSNCSWESWSSGDLGLRDRTLAYPF